MSRSTWAALLAAAALAVGLVGWFVTGWGSARFEAQMVASEPVREARQRAGDLANELGRRLEELRSREGERPYYHFQNLFHDPRGASWGLSVAPSPLVEGTGDALIATHFQINPTGVLTIPSINEELPELSNRANLAGNRARLESLRAAKGDLEAPELVASLAKPAIGNAEPEQQRRPRRRANRPVQQAASPPPQQQQQVVLSNEAFTQNAMPNAVFENIRKNPVNPPAQTKSPAPGQTKSPAPTRSPAPTKTKSPAKTDVTVTISSYSWTTAEIDDRAHVVGRRAVSTPSGSLLQGFVIDPAELESWLAERSGARLALDPPERAGHIAAPVAALGDDWHVVVDAGPELAAAAGQADSIERRFLLRFGGIAGGALALVGMLVFVVFRAERLARQRSQFAAAAAHELRTPLAGLQLYGDMLADGLGDPEKTADYARRVAEEAGRLGRVVTNVLGFSRLERGALTCNPRPGDLAEAVRRAIDRQRSSLEDAGVELEIDLPDTLTARFDDDAVAQILQNLLDNAEKYSRDSEARAISIAACRTRDDIAVEIVDSGAGVAPDKESSLFRPFERLAGDDAPAGLGLGLALSRELARAMGGDLRYSGRAADRGARFVLLLPR